MSCCGPAVGRRAPTKLIEAVELRDSRPVAPPTVYRALHFLMVQGFVSRIESLNAYVPCAHPERDHDCLFFICSGCRASVELEDPRIGGLLAEDAAGLGFVATRRTVEVQGMCAQWRGSRRRGLGGNEEPHPWRAGIRMNRRGGWTQAPPLGTLMAVAIPKPETRRETSRMNKMLGVSKPTEERC